ncbi:G-protein coupled receptor 55-like [Hemicordylus capensis]|uniref:G-protein coupled receptor 55-like n=1 Tax=Hemicordylus capensis TaxID=884348 RepID=UPI0023044BA9|nr:G-protein coupled receptor 55-like [Hemicordylus capensis]XP_053162085.1 G-protein coupled receptor 55-like [Hemicordylus capensis]XP_053162086.1 G-protein coupled receptor 55-like [Hemicordylus capensis]XP_053162087.1 G-protein coupled receptor 55-like [Hemicordylus capensis]XP_053162088.1 G-protein coupled receptor 55-like [Hemicordylus capensis]XP_053162089.1 G-protein coupled receptor 55-like [Hemicordylus capensis]
METSTLQANCTILANRSRPIQQHVELFQLSVYIPTFMLGLVFNGMAMWFALCKIRQLTEPVIYMVSLIFLDTLMLFVLPFKIISYHKRKWDLGSAFCLFLESLYFVNMYGSILISTCICVDRYIAILHPFQAVTLRSPRKAAITCAIISAGVWAGTAYTSQLHEHAGPTSCFHSFSGSIWNTPVLLAVLETVFLSCMVTTIFCTVQIAIRLQRSQQLAMKKSRSINIIMANLATFLVCFTPFHMALVLYYLVKNCILDDGQEIIRTFLQISLCWANLNCFMDAICYYFVFKEFSTAETAQE